MDISHPWRWLRDRPQIRLHWRDLPAGYRGVSDATTGQIWMHTRLLQRERRSTLAHEREHLIRDHRGCQTDEIERVVRHHAARWLLPSLDQVVDALIWAQGDPEVMAEELWVDRATALARLDRAHLAPYEKTYLAARLADHHLENA